ncbi:unnamed protein product [Haemonchus placei]|uniref:PI31_Prot_N domain-containing protein n=1 Tax=Haemonchus placei TaxID=6290 RepID=A0A0N4VXY0_HAEPC|nr:unnamed protein product [Haemonchus placei]
MNLDGNRIHGVEIVSLELPNGILGDSSGEADVSKDNNYGYSEQGMKDLDEVSYRQPGYLGNYARPRHVPVYMSQCIGVHYSSEDGVLSRSTISGLITALFV